MNEPFSVLFVVGKMPPFGIIMGHMPHRLRPMPPPYEKISWAPYLPILPILVVGYRFQGLYTAYRFYRPILPHFKLTL